MKNDFDDFSWREICEALGIDLSSPKVVHRTNGDFYLLCFMHQEKTPSLRVWNSSRRYRCFGCGCNGTRIDFIRRFLGLHDATDEEITLQLLHLKIRERKSGKSQLVFPGFALL